jgi:hypothetical protein
MTTALTARVRRIALAGFMLASAIVSSRAEIFVKISDYGKGDATIKGHKEWFELKGGLAWSAFGTVVGNTWQSAPEPLVLQTSGQSPLTVSALADLADKSLAERDMELHVVKTSSEHNKVVEFAYYRLFLGKAKLVQCTVDAQSHGDGVTTTLAYEYEKFRIEHHYGDEKDPKSNVGELGALAGLVLTGGSSVAPVTAFADFRIQQFAVTGTSGLSTNAPPSLSTIPDVSWSENRVGTRRFQALDDKLRSTDLAITAIAANPLLLPDENLVIRHVATNTFELAMAPVRNTTGTTEVIVRASDEYGDTETRFTATVTPGNKVPQISPTLRGTRMNANQSLTVAFAIIDVDTPVTNLVLSVTAANTNLFPQASLVVTSTSEFGRNLVLTPPPGAFGTSTITVSVTDGIFTTSQTFTVAVNGQVSGAPTNITAPITILDTLVEELPTGTILGTLNVTDPTPGDTHVLTMLDGVDGRFGITNNNQLVVTSGGKRLNRETPGFNGLFDVLVMATDQAGNSYTRVMSLPVINLNDAPTFRIFAGPWFVQPDAPTPVPTCVATDEDAGFVYPVRLTLTSTSGTLLVATNTLAAGSVSGNGTASVVISALINPITTLLNTPGAVTYVPNSGFSGNFTVTLLLEDLNSLNTTAIGIDPDYPAKSATLVHHGFVLPSQLAVWSLDEHGNDIFDASLQSSLWGTATDRDGDGFANLFEYALGYNNVTRETGNPMAGELLTVPAAMAGRGGAFFLTGAGEEPAYNAVSFVVREDPRLVTWVEAANRLTPLPDWSSNVSQIALHSRVSLGNGFERLTFRDPDPSRRYRVYRLGMSYLPPSSGQ